jgi:hypothetical protein
LGTFIENRPENPNFVKIGQKYRALYVKNQERFIIAADIKSP